MTDIWQLIVEWATQPGLLSVAVGLGLLAFVLGTLELIYGRTQLRRRSISSVVTDVAFWAFTPLVTKAITYTVLALVLGPWLGVAALLPFLREQPFWLQFLQVAVIGDLLHYWSHRLFHRPLFWPMHAVHHSPTELDWLSSMRLHPLNDLATRTCQALPILALGYDPAAVVLYIPIVVLWVIISHTDLPWTFGPLRYVFVSPVFHQWHHSSQPEAIDKNFAGLFSFWDWAFGTYFLPTGKRPERYGVSGPSPSTNFPGLIAHPFRVWFCALTRLYKRLFQNSNKHQT